MEDKLKELKQKLSGLLYSRDIEDIVFDNNGIKYYDSKKCNGRRVIDAYNSEAKSWNAIYSGPNRGPAKLIVDIIDTKHFSLSYSRPPDNNRCGIFITVFYFKEIIIIEEQQVCVSPNLPKYSAMRHYFTPDILLFLKHFHKPENTERAIGYMRQNPHYFKHYTTDTPAIIKNIYDTVGEMLVSNNTIQDTIKSLEQKIIELETQNQTLQIANQTLQNKINEMEENAKRSESPAKLKIE